MFTQWFYFQLANFVVQILKKSNYVGKKRLLSISQVDGALKQHKIKCLFSERCNSLLKVIMSRQALIVQIDVVMSWLLSNHMQHQGEDERFTRYSLLFTRSCYFLPVTRYWLIFTCYSLLLTRYSLLFTRYSLLSTRYLLPFTRYYLLVTTFLLLFTCYSLLFTCYSLLRNSLLLIRYSLLYFSFVTTYLLLITFYSLFLFIKFYYLLVKLWKLSDVKSLNISYYASSLHIKRLKEFQNLFQLSINIFRSPKNAVKLIGKTYVNPHLKHFSKYEAAISELRAA